MHPANVITIGDDTWPDPTLGPCGYVDVTWKAKVKVDKKVADGKNGAKATVKGKEVSEGELTVYWIDDSGLALDGTAPINDRAMELLNKWSPAGEMSGKAFEMSHVDQGPSGLNTIMFEELDGPKRENGKASHAKLKFTSWSEPAKVDKKGTDADTPKTADKWDKDANGKSVSNPTDDAKKGGFGGDNKPAAKP